MGAIAYHRKVYHERWPARSRQAAGPTKRCERSAVSNGYPIKPRLTRNDAMKDTLKIFGLIALAGAFITFLWFVLLPLTAAEHVVNRVATKYDTETSKQAYDTSRQYQQGTQLDLSRYCAQYAQATGSGKTGLAGLIRDTAATYNGPLTPNNQACLSEVGQ